MKLIISLALSIGGSTSQSLAGILSHGLRGRVKDRLEDRLHALVISRKLDLETAQREIATDWIAAYKKYIGPSPDAGHRHAYARAGANGSAPSDSRGEAAAPDGSSTAKVWVNTSSGKIFSARPAMVRKD
jgi:hypothetical protein